MEQFAAYLLRSALWLSVFALVWVVFLRNERYFTLKRFYLISGILSSFLLPLVTFRYNVEVPVPASELMVFSEQAVTATAGETAASTTLVRLLFMAYLAGIISTICRMAIQIIPLLVHACKLSKQHEGRANIISSPEASPSFSFFNYVFINPTVDEDQRRDILNHEMAHVRQKHWIDLIMAELLCTIQWFNPLAWIWARFIRQNHEYLADGSALKSSAEPAVYRATLLNHILGSRVLTLSNSFNQSINKKRFDMMKQKISSPYRKMRVLLVLPVMAVLMYAFAEPAYQHVASGDNSRQDPAGQQQSEKMVRGRAGQRPTTRPQSAIRTNTIDDSTLILVDGIKTSKINMYTINASDIESISVIKSREAVRTYAEEGITSVILITTKQSE